MLIKVMVPMDNGLLQYLNICLMCSSQYVVFWGPRWQSGNTLRLPSLRPGFKFPAGPQVGKLVVADRCSAVYSTEP